MSQVRVEIHPDVSKFSPEVQAILNSLSPNQITYFNGIYRKRRKELLGSFVLSAIGFDRLYHGQYCLGLVKALVVPIGMYFATRLSLNIGEVSREIAWMTELHLGGPKAFAYTLMGIFAIPAFLWWLADLASSFSRTWALNERIALEVAKQVKELVEPNAPPPISTSQESWLLSVLTAIAVILVTLVIVLMLLR